jgi:hypothetical protein
VWELGTSGNPRKKAQDDYRNRSENPMGVDPAATAFIVVSLRKWDESDRQDWLTRRNMEGIWRTVVALDADDLDGWLDETPAVRIWVSEQMGRRPRDVVTLDLWWQHWAGVTRPKLPAELLLAGRQHQAEELRELLTGGCAAHGVLGPSRDEALAFAAAAFLPASSAPPEGDLALPGLVVASAEEWSRLVDTAVPAVLVPAFASTSSDVAAAVRAGHHVIIPMGLDEDPDRAVIVLPPIAHDSGRDALLAAGWSYEDADRDAARARRSLQSLRRDSPFAGGHPRERDAADPYSPERGGQPGRRPTRVTEVIASGAGVATGPGVAVGRLQLPQQGATAGQPVRLAPRPPTLAGREDLLTGLDARLSAGDGPAPRTTVLCGLGGAGKTSVAVEYAYRHLGHVGVAWQFAAEDATVLAAGFAELAAQLGARALDDIRNPVATVHAILARFPEPWLLIFDNAADLAVVAAYLPPAGPGQVLITSQNPNWPGQRLEVPMLPPDVAADFLVSRTGDGDRQAALHLADTLGGLPLALEQAAAYLQATGDTLASYLALFRQRQAELLARGEPAGYDKRVTTTWALAFAELEQDGSAAVGLLRFVALLRG